MGKPWVNFSGLLLNHPVIVTGALWHFI